ncbi:response regulator containing a CheY-like receiver domain and an HTH DNA-binding domain [Desulfosporosinus acidiphilus SJ4]|uniref:Stage 0 sporulation protein A homolog n=1 Tax=Desulfosporosinus acidiphilus (strain DSM 22704 / JCM 16185 / SJ4) TaxID=646529 RepID=I4D0N7_DESAJ|nr:response regulator containing a CheY-like receiver domain and an HTH DNA-binding domain [Desulfosporosinus acidiphilus SJ4]
MKVLIADDQKLLRESFRTIIERNSEIKVVACASNGKEAYELCGKLRPDVVLMDISMPLCNGTEATKLIKSQYPNIKVLIVTASDDQIDVCQAIRNGADGYILKSVGTEELILSIKSTFLGLQIIHKDVFKPETFAGHSEEPKAPRNNQITVEGVDVKLTDRELDIIEMIVEGKDNKEISASLFIAEGTVKNIITTIISKLHLKDRTQLAVFAIKNSLI